MSKKDVIQGSGILGAILAAVMAFLTSYSGQAQTVTVGERLKAVEVRQEAIKEDVGEIKGMLQEMRKGK